MEDTNDNYPASSFDDVRRLLDEGVEMLYVHDEKGETVAMILPREGWWQSQLPQAPPEHFSHEHIFPWGGS